jgi:hypothetical protein
MSPDCYRRIGRRPVPFFYIAKQKFFMANGYWTVRARLSIVDRLTIP